VVVLNKGVLVGSCASVLTLAAGSVAGYYLAKHRLEDKYKIEAEKEIAEARRFYNVLHKKNGYQTPEEAASELHIFDQAMGAMRQYQGRTDEHEVIENHPVPVEEKVQDQHYEDPNYMDRNVFEGNEVQTNETWHAFIDSRDERWPYIISKEEFFQGEKNYSQVTLTYFAGDKVLADERDQYVDTVDDTVGLDNLDRFGYWSEDPRSVYIRNDRLTCDFEVLLSDGKYSIEVMGLDDEPVSESTRQMRVVSNPAAVPARSRFQGHPG
jgi:hypothetical protein